MYTGRKAQQRLAYRLGRRLSVGAKRRVFMNLINQKVAVGRCTDGFQQTLPKVVIRQKHRVDHLLALQSKLTQQRNGAVLPYGDAGILPQIPAELPPQGLGQLCAAKAGGVGHLFCALRRKGQPIDRIVGAVLHRTPHLVAAGHIHIGFRSVGGQLLRRAERLGQMQHLPPGVLKQPTGHHILRIAQGAVHPAAQGRAVPPRLLLQLAFVQLGADLVRAHIVDDAAAVPQRLYGVLGGSGLQQ